MFLSRMNYKLQLIKNCIMRMWKKERTHTDSGHFYKIEQGKMYLETA